MHIMKDFTLKRGAIVVLLTIMSVSLASGQTDRVYVSTSGSGFSAIVNHDSWDDATNELQEAINALSANGGGEIWVESGLYTPTHTYDGSEDTRRRSFVMREGVTVIGGFDGTETSLEQRDNFGYNWNNGNPSAQANATVFSGDLGGESAYHVVYTNGLSNDFVVLSDVIITDGIADGAGVDGRGAGIQTRGGGVFNNLMIYGNMANKGGGIYAYRGGIFNNCELTDNDARDDEGGFIQGGASLGGGIYLHLEGGEVNNCFIYDNFTTGSGAGICSTGGAITNSRFIINEAERKGGAVYSYGDMDGDVPTSGGTYKNCLMASNTSWVDGGGIFAADTGTWVNCTVVSNRATDGGGGVYSGSGSTFTNIIIWGNESPDGAKDIVSSPGGIFTHVLVDSSYVGSRVPLPGVNNSVIDTLNMDANGPHFVSPTAPVLSLDYGRGRTSTEWNANLNADWRLQLSSPLLNAGTPDVSLLELGDEDLAGSIRVVQDTVDVGAYELLYYALSANNPENGSIVITDDSKVLPGGSATITLTPDENFQLLSFELNGTNGMGRLSPTPDGRELVLDDIQVNYAIEAMFVSLNEYTITVSSNLGGELTPSVPSTAYEGRDFEVLIEPAYGFKVKTVLRDEQVVTGDIVTNQDGILSYTIPNVQADHTVAVEFAPYYVVTINGTAGGTVDPAGDNELFTDEDLPVTITPDVDYMVATAMLGDADVLDELSPVGDDSYTYLVADLTANTIFDIEFSMFHIVSASVGVGGSVSHPGDTKVPVGGDLNVIITPDEGFKLTSLFVDGEELITEPLDGPYSYLFSEVDANAEISVAFTEYFVVTVNETGGGLITHEGENHVLTGEELSVIIDPGENAIFDRAFLNGDPLYVEDLEVIGVNLYRYYITNVTEAMTFDVVFTPLYTISTSSNAGGSVAPVEKVISGESRDVTMTANAGYRLTSLLVDGGEILPAGFVPVASYTHTLTNVDKDYSIEAVFSPYFLVMVTAGGGGSVDKEGFNEVIQGRDLPLVITPDPGYTVVSALLKSTLEVELAPGDGGALLYTIENVVDHTNFDVEFGIAAGVDKIGTQENITVLPNPVNQVLKVTGDVKSAQLLNMSGTVVAHFNQDELKGNINVGHLANGLYILKHEDGRGVSGFIKIIIKH